MESLRQTYSARSLGIDNEIDAIALRQLSNPIARVVQGTVAPIDSTIQFLPSTSSIMAETAMRASQFAISSGGKLGAFGSIKLGSRNSQGSQPVNTSTGIEPLYNFK